MPEEERGNEPTAKLWAGAMTEAMRAEFYAFIKKEAEKIVTEKKDNFDEEFYTKVRDFIGSKGVGEDTVSALLRLVDRMQFKPLERLGRDRSGSTIYVDITFRNEVVRAKFVGILSDEARKFRHGEADSITGVGVYLGGYKQRIASEQKPEERPKSL